MESGRGGMGSHKHGVSGHIRNNPRNMKVVARQKNAETDQAAALREQRMHEDMTDDVQAVLGTSRRTRTKR